MKFKVIFLIKKVKTIEHSVKFYELPHVSFVVLGFQNYVSFFG